MRTLLNSGGDAVPSAEQRENPRAAGSRASEQEKRLESKKQELRRVRREVRRIRNETDVMEEPEQFVEQRRRKKRLQQEIFELERQLGLANRGGEPVTGALPDFVVIGTQKGGTTLLYHLLVQHPLVEPAARKELHFFDLLFDFGTEWYRHCFPAPRWENGRRTITGEATPYYLFHPRAAERMAEVVPDARLIALLRDPVDRAYSHYQQGLRKGKESRTFEEAIDAEEARLRSERDKLLEDEYYVSFKHQSLSYLSRGIYIEQLLRWAEFFPREQLLVLKSEDFFEDPNESLKRVIEFLELPQWDPEDSELESAKRNAGGYAEGMDPTTRRRLEEYFEPHNSRLYDFLGVDFGW